MKLAFLNTMDIIAIIYTILRQHWKRILAYIKRQIFIKILLYLQVLLARPVRIAFLGKDVVQTQFVVRIAIPYISEMFAQNKNILHL